MTRKALWIIPTIMVIAATSLPAFGAGGTADDALTLTLPYVTVGTDHYRGIFQFVSFPQDPSGAYWKLTWAGLTRGAGPGGGVLDASLNIVNAVVMYQGYLFDIDLLYTPNPQDPSSLYWKLGRAQALPARILSVGGGDESCYDVPEEILSNPALVQQIVQCLQRCGDDPQCILGCLPPELGLGSPFYVTVTFVNDSPQSFAFKIPAGTVFYPDDESLQPMMILHEPAYELQPGLNTVCIPTYCLRADLSAPDAGAPYKKGILAGNSCVYEVVELTYGKTLSDRDKIRIQDILWECGDSGTLSPENRAYLESLP